MVKINGVELKGIKPTVGMEGHGFYANVYIGGKKAGDAADYGDGGCLNIHIDPEFRTTFTERLKAYAKVQKNDSSYDEESFINELYDLTEIEKYFKKETKKYNRPLSIVDIKKTVFIAPNSFYTHNVGMCTFEANRSEAAIQEQLRKQKVDFDRLIIYRKLEDFTINAMPA